MYDVVPPAPPPANKPRRRLPQRRVPSSTVPLATPRVVTLQWRLPARLRRPIRHELARARQQQKRQQAIVAFERRPLYSQVPTTPPTYGRPQPTPANSSAQQHAGDVYQRSRPNVVVGMPPYRGGARRTPAPPTSRPAALLPLQKTASPAPQRTRSSTVSGQISALASDVRDVPYRWGTAVPHPEQHQAVFVNEARQLLAPVQPPKRRLAFPLHFSIFPWRKKRPAAVSGEESKKKL